MDRDARRRRCVKRRHALQALLTQAAELNSVCPTTTAGKAILLVMLCNEERRPREAK